MKRLISALLFAAFAVTAAGCTATRSDSGPPQGAAASRPAPAPDSFAPGTCRKMAPDVLAVWKMSTGLQGQTQMTMADRHALKARQQALIAAMPGASPELRAVLNKVVNEMGWVRFRTDTHTYQPWLMDKVVKADSAMLNACVH